MAIALLWALHPLQTEAVTYIVQRVESMMGLFFLLTLYCFIRSVEAPRPRPWQGCAVAACILGAATKEVIALAPVLVLLYDRTFIAGSFAAAWRRRWRVHLALASTWVVLAVHDREHRLESQRHVRIRHRRPAMGLLGDAV